MHGCRLDLAHAPLVPRPKVGYFMVVSDRREREGLGDIARDAIRYVWVMLGITAFLWVAHAVNAWGFGGALSNYGIRPREPAGLWGILAAPFLHGDINHLLANTTALVPLGLIVLFRGGKDFVVVSLVGIVFGGLGTWASGGDHSVHIGASGVIFAYFGYGLLRGIFDRSILSVMGSLIVGIGFGGMIFGVLPGERGISWEGHLFGFVSGALTAWGFAAAARRKSARAGKQLRV